MEDGGRRLGGPELGVEQARGGVVDDGDEGGAQAGDQAQPGMGAAVEVQQVAEAGPRLAPAAMTAPGAALADQAGLLQGQLHEAVGQAERRGPAGRSGRSGGRSTR